MKSVVTLIKINLILIACPVLVAAGSDWKFIANEEGVTLYSRQVSGHSEHDGSFAPEPERPGTRPQIWECAKN